MAPKGFPFFVWVLWAPEMISIQLEGFVTFVHAVPGEVLKKAHESCDALAKDKQEGLPAQNDPGGQLRK